MSGFKVNYNGDSAPVWNDLYLDKDGNIAYSDNQLDDTVENCYHAVLLTKGDWVFDTNIGINWQKYLTTDSPVGNQIKASITQAIKGVSGVKNINYINFDVLDSRQLTININIQAIDGLSYNIPTITV